MGSFIPCSCESCAYLLLHVSVDSRLASSCGHIDCCLENSFKGDRQMDLAESKLQQWLVDSHRSRLIDSCCSTQAFIVHF